MKLWNDLLKLKGDMFEGICVVGDFNVMTIRAKYKCLSNNFSSFELAEFHEFIDTMELLDVPMLGNKFTWFKADENTLSQLD